MSAVFSVVVVEVVQSAAGLSLVRPIPNFDRTCIFTLSRGNFSNPSERAGNWDSFICSYISPRLPCFNLVTFLNFFIPST